MRCCHSPSISDSLSSSGFCLQISVVQRRSWGGSLQTWWFQGSLIHFSRYALLSAAAVAAFIMGTRWSSLSRYEASLSWWDFAELWAIYHHDCYRLLFYRLRIVFYLDPDGALLETLFPFQPDVCQWIAEIRNQDWVGSGNASITHWFFCWSNFHYDQWLFLLHSLAPLKRSGKIEFDFCLSKSDFKSFPLLNMLKTVFYWLQRSGIRFQTG